MDRAKQITLEIPGTESLTAYTIKRSRLQGRSDFTFRHYRATKMAAT
jgi:hypothetical protein